MGVLMMLSRSFFVKLELIIRNVKLPQQLLSVSKLNKNALTAPLSLKYPISLLLLCQLSSNTKAACENLNFSSQALPSCTSEFSQLEESEIFPQVFLFLSPCLLALQHPKKHAHCTHTAKLEKICR
jgi:hypothetical protein